jgi:8-oxo-dGTP pyrophosphatase MutT (NUDIX family)
MGSSEDAPAEIEVCAGGLVCRSTPEGVSVVMIRNRAGRWTLPKGHVEGDERPLDAAIRETAEETGITPSKAVAYLGTIVYSFRDPRPGREGKTVRKRVHFFLFEGPPDAAPRPQLEENIVEAAWVPFDEALRTAGYPLVRTVLLRARRYLPTIGPRDDPDAS